MHTYFLFPLNQNGYPSVSAGLRGRLVFLSVFFGLAEHNVLVTFAFAFRAFSRCFLSEANYICHKKEKQHYICVGTVRLFIESSAKRLTITIR